MKTSHILTRQEEVRSLCRSYLPTLHDRHIVLLEGPLGSGKTFFVAQCLQELGVPAATSPTFSLIQEAKAKDGRVIYHLDLYRLEKEEELEGIGFWDLFQEKMALIFIEWSSRLKWEDLPFDWSIDRWTLAFADGGKTRRYDFEKLREP